jgi:hypothetical protein
MSSAELDSGSVLTSLAIFQVCSEDPIPVIVSKLRCGGLIMRFVEKLMKRIRSLKKLRATARTAQGCYVQLRVEASGGVPAEQLSNTLSK